MGEYADDIIDKFCDQSGDYTYKYNQKNYKYYPESQAEKNIRLVRKELAILIKQYKQQGIKSAVETARKDINLKYGKGWRERGLCVNDEDQWKPLNEYK